MKIPGPLDLARTSLLEVHILAYPHSFNLLPSACGPKASLQHWPLESSRVWHVTGFRVPPPTYRFKEPEKSTAQRLPPSTTTTIVLSRVPSVRGGAASKRLAGCVRRCFVFWPSGEEGAQQRDAGNKLFSERHDSEVTCESIYMVSSDWGAYMSFKPWGL